MKINRANTLTELYDFCQGNHGVVIGKPGIGKSFLLSELKTSLISRGIVSFVIKLDNIDNSSDNEIEKELGITSNWIETFKKVKLPESFKAVLIFDSFDSIRDENLRVELLSQIKKAIAELSSKWNIIVSVRTYDATKSPELINLFPSSNKADGTIHCRNFEIPTLSENELQQYFQHSHEVAELYSGGTDKLKEILKIPYFLMLLKKIITNTQKEDLIELKRIKSETQLLSKYWDIKIRNRSDSFQIESLLLKITESIVANRSISIAKKSLADILLANSPSFEYLHKEDILIELSVNKSRIGYSHNILFDFAVSQLIFSEEISELYKFIKEDSSSPFFLRPSFVYFFTQLWYFNKTKFWEIYQSFFVRKDEREIQLLVVLILNSVVVSEYDTIEDLDPILNYPNPEDRTAIIKKTLQSIRFIKDRKLFSNDLVLLKYLSERLDIQYLWEFSFVLEKAVNDNLTSDDKLGECGVIVRNFFNYIQENRTNKQLPLRNLDRLGSISGVVLVAKTYKTDIQSSRILLEKVLTLLNEADFEIWYFSILCDSLKFILPFDAEFVAFTYVTIYSHKETSDAKTQMGGPLPMNFMSNRRQDFDMCHYRLKEFFPTFIKSNPSYAIPTALKITNLYAIDYISRNHDAVKKFDFVVNGIDCFFIPDLSSLWGDDLDHKSAELIVDVIKFFQQLADDANFGMLIPFITHYIKHAEAAFTWKKLIEFATKYPDQLKEVFIDFCTSITILENSDTSVEIGAFISVAIRNFDDAKRAKIETAILSLSNDRYTIRLLNCIPENYLVLDESRKMIQSKPKIPNEPFFKFHSSISDYTTRDWLEDENIDTTKPIVVESLEMMKTLDEFNRKWLNNPPPLDEGMQLVKVAIELFNITVNRDIENKVLDANLQSVAKTLSIASRNQKIIQHETNQKIVKKILIHCFNYISVYDIKFDNDTAVSRGYSSTPRIDAAEGIVNIAVYNGNEEVVDIVKSASIDKNAIIRFQVIKCIHVLKEKYPEIYLDTLFNSLKKEKDTFTLAITLHNLSYYQTDDTVINEVLTIISNRPELTQSSNNFTELYAHLLLILFEKKSNKLAESILFESKINLKFCTVIVFKLAQLTDPNHPSNKYHEDKNLHNPLFDLLLFYIKSIETNLSLFVESDIRTEDSKLSELFSYINYIVERIYFSIALNGFTKGNEKDAGIRNKPEYYKKIKPHLETILGISSKIHREVIVANTAYYFMQILNKTVEYDPKTALSMANKITKLSQETGFTFDYSAIKEITSLTEKLLADHREILLEKESFDELIELLNVYVNSNWVDALQLLWKLDEVFK